MEHYLSAVNQFLQTRPHLGELFAFIIALAESLPLIGTVIPGSVTMTVIGILVGRGIMPLPTTLMWASIGALVGDTIGFWVGKYFDEGLRHIWPFKKHPNWLTHGENFFKKHGGKSIVIGRFVGPARSSVPLIAGLLKMDWARFFVAAIPSAVLWAIAYTIPGVLIGAISLELPPAATTKFILIGLIVVVCLWLVFWAIQHFFVLLGTTINRGIDNLWDWSYRHHSSKSLIRLITNHRTPSDHHQLTLMLLAIISLLAFIVLFLSVVFSGVLTHLNAPLFYFLQSIQTIHSKHFFVVITMLGKSHLIIPVGLLIAVGLCCKKQWRTALHLFAAIAITTLAVLFFKWAIYSPRPIGFLHPITSSSFPSGHTTLSVVIWGFITFLCAQQLGKKWHWIPYTAGITLIACIGFSRVFLGAHWFTDVIGGILLGLGILLSVIISYRRYPPDAFAKCVSWIVLSIMIVVPSSAYCVVRFHQTLRRFQRLWPTHTISINGWWSHPERHLPVYRTNRFGKPIQPFNLQWADTLPTIQHTLIRHGWTLIHSRANLKSTLMRFTSYKPEKHFPLFPLLYRHHTPDLFMIKHLSKQSTIVELRLWPSGVTFVATLSPLWIGSVNYHTAPRQLITLKKRHFITFSGSSGLRELSQSLGEQDWKIVTIAEHYPPKKIKSLDWNGSILLVRPGE